MFNSNINVMNIDLFKYIIKMLEIPALLLSFVLIVHGTDDNISFIHVISFILLMISGSSSINNKNE